VLLIAYYVAFMIAGDLSDYLIGLIVERESVVKLVSSSSSRSISYFCGSLGSLRFG
jgi:hypothetical protein